MKVNLLAFLETLAVSSDASGLLINSSLTPALVQLFGYTSGGSAMRSRCATVLGIMIRYATVIDTEAIVPGVAWRCRCAAAPAAGAVHVLVCHPGPPALAFYRTTHRKSACSHVFAVMSCSHATGRRHLSGIDVRADSIMVASTVCLRNAATASSFSFPDKHG